MRTRRRGKLNSILFTIILVMFFCSIQPVTVNAANKTLTVEQAKSMALKNSDEYRNTQSKLLLAKTQYVQSIKKIKMKKKNQSTLKWTPPLTFKLPEKPDLTDEFEYTYKPLELQSEIDVLNHKLNTTKYGMYEKAGLQFCKVYELQERIAFTKERIESAKEGLAKNEARLRTGEATQADVDKLQADLDKLNDSLTTDTRNFETEKSKLSDIIGMNVNNNYTFRSPFLDAEITEQMLKGLQDYTVENDHSFYETRVATGNGLLALNTNYSLMKNQYGGKMSLIDTFVNQAKRGEKIDGAAFKLKYDELLTDVDARWQGKRKILFIRVPKDFFKGKIDGANYVENEPYALYEAALEYQGLVKEEQSAEKELRSQVEDAFRNYVSARLAVIQTKENIEKQKENLAKSKLLNATGKMTFEEYSAELAEYEEEQLSLLSVQSEYSKILYSLDKLTCGSVTSIISGTGTVFASASQGTSFVVKDEGEGVYYYIRSLVYDDIFELGLSISEDFEGSITDFELYINGEKLGEKTSVEKTIRHFSFDLKDTDIVKIRLWDGNDFVDDCVIDPTVYTGKLAVTIARRVETNEESQVAEYYRESGALAEMTSLHIVPKAGEMIASYNIKNSEGTYLISNAKVPIENRFNYLGMTDEDLNDLTICFYDEDGKLLYECTFRTSDSTIHKID